MHSLRQEEQPTVCIHGYVLDYSEIFSENEHTKVVLGWDGQNNKDQVVVKVIDLNKLNDRELIGARRELTVMKRIKGKPYLVNLLDSFELEDKLYFVMEYMKWDLLSYVKAQGPIPQKKCRKIFLQIVEAVKILHDMHIIHCDIKLKNVLFNPQTEQICLIDFGLCRLIDDDNQYISRAHGTPCYSAPEIYLQKEYDAYKLDVYSLGVLLYVLFFGSLPFDDFSGVPYYRALSVTCESSEVGRPDLRFSDSSSTNYSNYRRKRKVPKHLQRLLISLLALSPDMRPSLSSLLTDSWLTHTHKQTYFCACLSK